ncbi:LysR family transcriptional regulator [Vibrio sp. SCSIO 43136]|uniref:LysR family transcriptional regulator n=1 Tax=Vibrio sp. SCSIO 43136 TaxID=2819101 RepID=UPI002075A5A3|nr:LysR family transcriptional regulator [Vibrio sp. SCSIO 43136]USD67529.1 LysR family transcriptional regulator [Vibrio sp. SCSIO 43136]
MLTRSDDLEVLLAVVDTGGFSSAAQALDIQVARVSRAVTRIEQQLGTSLLNRTTRRVELTDEGAQFVDSVRQGLLLLEQAEQTLVEQDAKPKGKLRVDAVSPFLIHQLVPLMQEFKHEYPDIELELTSNEGIVDLLEKRTDVAIRIGRLSDSTLHARPLGKSRLHIVASPAYLKRCGVPQKISQITQHQLLGFSGAKTLNQWPLPEIGSITPTMISSNGETVRQLALAGNGIACLSEFMLKEDLESGALVSLFSDQVNTDTGRENVNAVFYKSSALAKRISAFIDFIHPRLRL